MSYRAPSRRYLEGRSVHHLGAVFGVVSAWHQALYRALYRALFRARFDRCWIVQPKTSSPHHRTTRPAATTINNNHNDANIDMQRFARVLYSQRAMLSPMLPPMLSSLSPALLSFSVLVSRQSPKLGSGIGTRSSRSFHRKSPPSSALLPYPPPPFDHPSWGI